MSVPLIVDLSVRLPFWFRCKRLIADMLHNDVVRLILVFLFLRSLFFLSRFGGKSASTARGCSSRRSYTGEWQCPGRGLGVRA